MKREAIVLLAAFVSGAAWCVVVAPATRHDPLLALELSGGVIAAFWALRVGVNLVAARRLDRELDRLSVARVVGGVRVKVVRGAGNVALVTGTVRPSIYIGEGLLDELSADEQRAVLLHESHHRATRAPLRAAALEAWLSIAGRLRGVGRVLYERLVDLETMADTYAVAHGASRSALAGALLKTDAGRVGVSATSYGTERRVRALLGREAAPARHHLPYEWLPVAAIVVVTAACHVWGI